MNNCINYNDQNEFCYNCKSIPFCVNYDSRGLC